MESNLKTFCCKYDRIFSGKNLKQQIEFVRYDRDRSESRKNRVVANCKLIDREIEMRVEIWKKTSFF